MAAPLHRVMKGAAQLVTSGNAQPSLGQRLLFRKASAVDNARRWRARRSGWAAAAAARAPSKGKLLPQKEEFKWRAAALQLGQSLRPALHCSRRCARRKRFRMKGGAPGRAPLLL